MVDVRRIFGDNAEALAARHLEGKGMRILARQYKTTFGEIDLVARDGDEVVFVEVKARRSNDFGYPEEAVTRTKLEKIMRAGEWYLRSTHREDAPYRIDVVAIEFTADPPVLTHLVGVG
ncbi:YraN family protein [Candidatus Uhrbacteria bacterium]|nr:YraN family protein [Candidatus Uhrbacteria bacterium]